MFWRCSVCWLLFFLLPGPGMALAECAGRPLRILRTVSPPGQPPDRTQLFLERVFQRTDCKLVVVVAKHQFSIDQRLEMLNKGDVDVMIGLSRLPQRERLLHFVGPYRRERILVLARAEDAPLVKGRSFEGLTELGWRVLGPKTGWFGERYERIRQAGESLLDDYDSLPQAARLLNMHRADLVVVTALTFRTAPKPLQAAFKELDMPLHVDELFLTFSRKTVAESVAHQMALAVKAELAEYDPFAEP